MAPDDRRTTVDPAPREVAGDAQPTGTQAPVTDDDRLADFKKKAANARTMSDARKLQDEYLRLRDEYRRKKGEPAMSAEAQAALSATGDAFWRAYFFHAKPDLEQATEKDDGTSIYASISQSYSTLYRDYVDTFINKLPEYRDAEDTQAKLTNYPRWAKLRGAYESFVRLTEQRRFPEASSLLEEVRRDYPEAEFQSLDSVIHKVKPVADTARRGLPVKVRDLKNISLIESNQSYFRAGLANAKITLRVKSDPGNINGSDEEILVIREDGEPVFNIPYKPKATGSPVVQFEVVGTQGRQTVRLYSPWEKLLDKETNHYIACQNSRLEEGSGITVELTVGRPPPDSLHVPQFSELFPDAPNSNPPSRRDSTREGQVAEPGHW